MTDKPKTTQETRSLEQLVQDVEKKKLYLPEFQRDFTWPEDKSITLFDSLFRNLFIGSLIISKPKFSLACKHFDFRKRGSSARRPPIEEITAEDFDTKEIYTLLDGQQRTTSLCRALRGDDDIYVIFKDISELESSDYYSKEKGPKHDDIMMYIEGFEKREPKNRGRFYMKISDFYHGGNHKSEKKIQEEFVQPLLDSMQISSEQKSILSDIAIHAYSLFKTDILKREKLLSVQLIDMDLESFCLYFERSNSQGVNLNFTDIITAKVYIKFKLKNAIAQARQNNTYLDDKKWWVEQVIRYINYKDYNEVTKGSILKNIKADSFQNHWDSSTSLLNEVHSYLVNQNWILSTKEIPYNSMLIPMVAFLENVTGNSFSKASKKQIDYVRLWFFLSILDGRYGGGHHGSTNVVLKKDCILMKDLGKEVFPKPEFWKSIRITFDFDEILVIENKNTIFQGIMSFLNYTNRFKNLVNDSNIDSSTDAKNDVHHIFPLNFLKKERIFKNQDSLLNKMIICSKVNKGISDKPPFEYLSNFAISNSSLSNCLDSHCIPHELMEDKNLDFQNFLKLRYDLINSQLEIIDNARQKAINEENDIWK